MDGLFKLAMSFQCRWEMIQAKAVSHGKDGMRLNSLKTVKKATE